MKKMLLFGAAILIAVSAYAVPEESVNYPDLVPGAAPASMYSFTQVGETLDTGGLPGNIKRILHRDGKLYVLTKEESPRILIIDSETLAPIKEMDLTGISGGFIPVSDIAFTADGYLLACNKAQNAHFNITAKDANFKVYSWEDDSAAPELFFKSNHTGNFNNAVVGETMAVTGPKSECIVYSAAQTASTSSLVGQVRIVGLLPNEKDAESIVLFSALSQTQHRWREDGEKYSVNVWGDDYQFMISPRSDDYIIVTSNGKILPTEYQFDWSVLNGQGSPVAMVLQSVFEEASGYDLFKTNGANYFRYAGQSYMAAPTADAGRVKAGVVLFDITDGLDQAVKVSEKLPEAGLGTAAAPYMTAYGTVKGKDIILGVLAQNQGFAKFTTGEGGDGILKPQKLSGVQVSPNPVQDIVRINCDFAITSIKLIDLTGRVIMNIPANQTSFDISGVAAGNYILLVNNSPVKIVKK